MLEIALTRKDLDEYTRSLLAFNRFHAYASMSDLAKANEACERIESSLNPATLEASQVKSLIRFCLIQNTQDTWLSLKPLLSIALDNLDHRLIFQDGDPARMLFSAYDERWAELGIEDVNDVRWRTIKKLHQMYFEGIKAYAQSLLDERNALAKTNLSPKSIVVPKKTNYFLLIGIPLLLLVLGGIFLYQWNQRRMEEVASETRASASNNAATVKILEQVERMVKEGDIDSSLNALISDLRSGELEKLQTHIHEMTATHELSEIERQALALFIHGYTGKQVAQMLDRSPGYMYNTRSKLRKVLRLPENEDFKDWYHNSSKKG